MLAAPQNRIAVRTHRAPEMQRWGMEMTSLRRPLVRSGLPLGSLCLVLVVGAACATGSPSVGCSYDVPASERHNPALLTSDFAVAPSVANRMDVARALEGEYPQDLRDSKCGGSVQVWFDLAADGSVRDIRVQTSSGIAALDEAALRVARIIEFTPAEDENGTAIPAQASFPITFRSL